MKFLNSFSQQNKDFREFLRRKQLSYSTFLLILLGSWLACYGTSVYFGILNFGSWQSVGRYLLLWLAWIAISFWLGSKPRYQKIIWYSNHLFFAFIIFFMMLSQPESWFLIFFEYNLLLFLILIWASACFFSIVDILFPLVLVLVGSSVFLGQNYSLFFDSSSAVLSLLLSFIFAVTIITTSVWNTWRETESLGNVYREKQNLEETAKVLRIRIRAKTKELRQQTEDLRQDSALKTQALRERVQTLERLRQVTVGRELKMIDFKKEINQLQQEIGKLKNGRRK